MFILAAFCTALVGHLSIAVPLESPTTDLKQYFDSRIVGGSDVFPGSAPHMVALVTGHYYISFVCGASIINNCILMTAAHCVVINWWTGELLDTFHGRVGTDHWNRGGHAVEFVDHAIHPHYNAWTLKNDIAMLRLTKSLEFGDTIAPIGIGSSSTDGGEHCYVTGWGTQQLWGIAADKLQILFLYTISGKECQKRLSEEHGVPALDTALELCTFLSAGYGMCHGDSGSALISKVTDKQIGIVSWGRPCAVGYPDVFVRVGAFLDFIKGFMKSHPCLRPHPCSNQSMENVPPFMDI